MAGIFCITFTLILGGLLFVSIFRSDIPAKSAATVMWLLLLGFLINPANMFLRTERFIFILVVVRILISPLHTVYFGDSWFAGQLNSLVGILLDMQYYTMSVSWPQTHGQTLPANQSVLLVKMAFVPSYLPYVEVYAVSAQLLRRA